MVPHVERESPRQNPPATLARADSLGRRWPVLFAVVTTAFGGTATTVDKTRRLEASTYIDEPFRISALVEVIRQVRSRAKG